MVTDTDGHIAALFNSPLENIELRRASDGVERCLLRARAPGMPMPVRRPELVLLSVLNPQPGEVCGCSMLKGLTVCQRIPENLQDIEWGAHEDPLCGHI